MDDTADTPDQPGERPATQSIVCMTYPDCNREHVAGLGGTPIHRQPDMIVILEVSHCRPIEDGR